MARGFKELLCDEEGNATTETVIMIPFFIIVFGAILYMGQGYEHAVDNAAKDREHAWAYVMDDCRSSDPHPGTTIRDIHDPPGGDLVSRVDGFVSGILSRLPLLEDSWPDPFFPMEAEGHRVDEDVEKPAVLGPGHARIDHRIQLMCNERRRPDVRLDDFTWEAWRMIP